MNNYSTILIVVCMECQKFLSVKDARGANGGLSHGLCEPCAEIVFETIRRKKAIS